MGEEELPVQALASREELHHWLLAHGESAAGLWVRLFRVKSGIKSVSFHELLEEGLCFGWSESQRRRYDEQSYLQKFTPRRGKKTQSERNLQLVEKLTREGRMRPAGYRALGLVDGTAK